jgi:twinkle protein
MAFVKYHLPCKECGSSDAVSLNADGSAYCFSCGTLINNYLDDEVSTTRRNKKMQDSDLNSGASFNTLTDRKISLNTAKFYGVKSTKDANENILKHYYPYYNSHELSATKVRGPNKLFSWKGNSKGTGLFGENLFSSDNGHTITITEGECDAMAAYEMMGSKWASVSIKSASTAVSCIKNSLEFLESYKTIVLCFDNDKAGKLATKEVAKILSPGKVKIVQLPVDIKDANDCLRQGRTAAFMKSWWDAKVYKPEGVINISEKLQDYTDHRKNRVPSIPYPWKGLNFKLEGMRLRELVTLTGGTGLGKSSVTRELEHWLINHTDDNVGIVALEESWTRTAEGVMSIEANAKLHLDSVKQNYTDKQLEDIFEKVFMKENEDRVWIYANHGVNNLDDIFNKLKYLIVGLDCKWIILDHLHMLVLSTLESDERKAIDGIMHRLRSLVEETGCGMILVSHLRRVDGNRGHENGIETGLSHLRGSQSIAQLSDCVISLERNQQADDPLEASTTKIRVLKSRYTGDVGIATRLYYCSETGRLKELDHQEEELLL